jgi:tagaturonate epimerase
MPTERPDDPTTTALSHGRDVVPRSARRAGGATLWAEAHAGAYRIVVATTAGEASAAGPGTTPGEASLAGDREQRGDLVVTRAEPTPTNLDALRALLPDLRPVPLALATSAGFGDRLGLATPGHVDALRAAGAVGRVAPVFAQQSMRENARTGRTPRQVVDDATLGAFVAGWAGPLGADADHLKHEEEIDTCLAAGYTLFTLDPGDHVDGRADALTGAALATAYRDAVPWGGLETDPDDLRSRLGGASFDLDDRPLRFGDGELERAAVKYGAAVAHVTRLARHLAGAAAGRPVELEVSVDETATPTTLAEHAYLASELRRLGVAWVSLAPRFVGAFEKGVDYIGDLGALAADLEGHAAVARALGPYKLSLHSGSDKFGVYPIAAQATAGAVHLKTAGTSYLEALRVAAALDPELLRAIARLGSDRFAEDVRSYHVSGRPAGMPDPAALPAGAVAALLEQRDARQVLHVTFGSALRTYGERLTALLRAHPDAYRAALRRHFERHLAPFVDAGGGA